MRCGRSLLCLLIPAGHWNVASFEYSSDWQGLELRFMPSKSLAVFPLDRQMSNDILETGRLVFLSLFLYFLTNLSFFKMKVLLWFSNDKIWSFFVTHRMCFSKPDVYFLLGENKRQKKTG